MHAESTAGEPDSAIIIARLVSREGQDTTPEYTANPSEPTPALDCEGIASGDFETVILENINSRSHFPVLLSSRPRPVSATPL